MSYITDAFIDRRNTGSAKWNLLLDRVDGSADKAIPLTVADMEFPCAEPIVRALRERADQRIYGYTTQDTGRFYRAVCGWYQHRFGWYLNSDDIFFSPGVVPAVGYLIDILTEPGERVLIQPPVYYPFRAMIESHGRALAVNPLIEENGYYRMDYRDLESKTADPNVRLMILCNPHNPVGRVWTKDELHRLAEICVKNHVRILSDEIHGDLIRRTSVYTPLEMAAQEYKDDIVTATAPSKTFNMAGLQISNIIIHNSEIQKKWRNYVMKRLGLNGPNAFAITAAQAAYEEAEDWLDETNAYIDGNFEAVRDFVDANLPKARFRLPEGTYLAWIDLSAYGYDDDQLDKELIESAKVGVEGGSIFGSEKQGFIRLNLAGPREMILEGMRRIAGFLNRYREGDTLAPFSYDTPWQSGKSFAVSPSRRTVLVFLRYYGCPLCQLDLRSILLHYSEFQKQNADVIVVIQSSPATLASQLSQESVPLDIACDPDGKLYSLFHVEPALTMEDMLSPGALSKISRARQAGLTHGIYEGTELQLPAVFIADDRATVQYAHYAKELGDMPSCEEILNRLENPARKERAI